MNKLTLILVAVALSFSVACSKKSSSGTVATTPTDTNNTYNPYPGTYNPNTGIKWPFNYSGGYTNPYGYKMPMGFIQISSQSRYKQFVKAAIDYVYYGNGAGYDDYSYDYSYTCDINIFRWIFEDDLVDCYSGQNQFSDYISYLASTGTLVLIEGINGNQAKMQILLGAMQDFGGSISYEIAIPMTAQVYRDGSGKLVLDAGSFAMVSTTNNGTVFHTYFENNIFGQVYLQ